MILDIQRAGPSTGMPTKPEQADLLMVLFGRNGESPCRMSPPRPRPSASTPRSRRPHRPQVPTPVYLLSDAYLANGSEPWLIPAVEDLPDISTTFAEAGPEPFQPYLRDPETLARPWAIRHGGASSTGSAGSRRRT